MQTKAFLCAIALLAPPLLSRGAIVTGPYSPNSGEVDWALGGVATQSSTALGAEARRAIDGNTDGDFARNSVTHTTATGLNNFWQVDFGTDRPIDELVLWSRTDCCADRLSNFTVSVTNSANGLVFSRAFLPGATIDRPLTLVTGAISGRVVKVQLNGFNAGGDGTLSLAEVEAKFQTRYAPFPNVALGKTARQSTTGFSGVAGRAVDGNTDGNYVNGSVAHTDPNAGGTVYWEVELGRDYEINEIALSNRTDCCGDRLSNFRISIFDGTSEVFGRNYFVGTGNALNMFSVFEDTGGILAFGDRVRVQLIGGVNNLGNSVLSLAEVQVFGQIPEPRASAVMVLLGGVCAGFARRTEVRGRSRLGAANFRFQI